MRFAMLHILVLLNTMLALGLITALDSFAKSPFLSWSFHTDKERANPVMQLLNSRHSAEIAERGRKEEQVSRDGSNLLLPSLPRWWSLQVTPICMKTQLPIILSHSILELEPDYFWLGAGEVDLKVGLSASEFARAYGPLVLDCTHDQLQPTNTNSLST